MQIFTRSLIGSVGGAAMSFGLAYIMIHMIAVEFKAEDTFKVAVFDINPKIDETVIDSPRITPPEPERVETPPPPPIIERTSAELPSEKIVDIGGLPDLPPPDIDIGGPIDFVVNDTDAQPIVRIPPIMPPRTERSGHCVLRFDVSASGEPYNIQPTFCSEKLFSRPSIKSVTNWKYKPKVQGGLAVTRNGVVTRISFNLADENGNLIPE